jgi:hypothetical protein
MRGLVRMPELQLLGPEVHAPLRISCSGIPNQFSIG